MENKILTTGNLPGILKASKDYTDRRQRDCGEALKTVNDGLESILGSGGTGSAGGGVDTPYLVYGIIPFDADPRYAYRNTNEVKVTESQIHNLVKDDYESRIANESLLYDDNGNVELSIKDGREGARVQLSTDMNQYPYLRRNPVTGLIEPYEGRVIPPAELDLPPRISVNTRSNKDTKEALDIIFNGNCNQPNSSLFNNIFKSEDGSVYEVQVKCRTGRWKRYCKKKRELLLKENPDADVNLGLLRRVKWRKLRNGYNTGMNGFGIYRIRRIRGKRKSAWRVYSICPYGVDTISP